MAPMRAVNHGGSVNGPRMPHHRRAARGTKPYDRAVDPNTARQVLRISPDTPLTPALIESAYAEESWTRHPSRYPEGPGRAQAEEWATTLGTARAVLLHEVASTATAAVGARCCGIRRPGPAAAQPRRRLSTGAIVGIVAGAVAVVALIGFAIWGGVRLVTDAAGTVNEAIEAESSDAPADVERFESSETFFTFPAALEIYADGRYNPQCPPGFASGCWQMALFTEADCARSRSNSGTRATSTRRCPTQTETVQLEGVEAGEETPLVFGNDDYEYGWVNQVTCLDSAG